MRFMKYLPITLALIAGIFLGGYGVLTIVKSELASRPEPDFHEHADFAMFLNGEQFDFSKQEFMSDKPCTVFQPNAFGLIQAAYAHGGAEHEEYGAHLHSSISSVVHVHRQGAKWHDFFEALGMEFSDTHFADHQGNLYENNGANSFRFFVNGEEVEQLAEREIRDLDQVLITYGSVSRTLDQIRPELTFITNNACKSSEACLHRGFPSLESCTVSRQEKPFLLEFLGL